MAKQVHKLNPTDESRAYVLRHAFRLFDQGKLTVDDMQRLLRKYVISGELPEDLQAKVTSLCLRAENSSSEEP